MKGPAGKTAALFTRTETGPSSSSARSTTELIAVTSRKSQTKSIALPSPFFDECRRFLRGLGGDVHHRYRMSVSRQPEGDGSAQCTAGSGYNRAHDGSAVIGWSLSFITDILTGRKVRGRPPIGVAWLTPGIPEPDRARMGAWPIGPTVFLESRGGWLL